MAYVQTATPSMNLFPGLFGRIRARLAQHAAYTQTVRELSALSDRDLMDIGLSRGDIDSVARGVVERA